MGCLLQQQGLENVAEFADREHWNCFFIEVRQIVDIFGVPISLSSDHNQCFIRILAMFDHDFHKRMEASNVRIVECVSDDDEDAKKESLDLDIKVDFEHAEAVKDIFTSTADFSHMYTVEISPPIGRSPQVTSVPIGSDGQPKFSQGVSAAIAEEDVGDPKKIKDQLFYDQTAGESPCQEVPAQRGRET